MQVRISQEQIEHFRSVKNQRVPHYIHFYGMYFLLRDILGFPSWAKLNVHLEHGIIIDQAKPDQYLAKTKADLIFVDNSFRKGMVPEKRNVFVLGSLFMRYRRKYKFKYDLSAKGTIVFPTHSSHHLSLDVDWKVYAEQLINLPSEFQPVTVCVYWLDVLNGEQKYFEEVGLNVITNGDMFDKNYAFNFYTNLVKHKYASGNEPGSFLFYAVEMGMPFFIYGPKVKITNDGFDDTAPMSAEYEDIDYAKKLKKAFTVDLTNPLRISEDQHNLVKLFSDDRDWIDLNTLRILALRNVAKTIFNRFKNRVGKTLIGLF